MRGGGRHAVSWCSGWSRVSGCCCCSVSLVGLRGCGSCDCAVLCLSRPVVVPGVGETGSARLQIGGSDVNTVTTFSRYVSAEGKARMIAEDHAGELVTVREYDGTTATVEVRGVSYSPDGEALLVVYDRDSARSEFFLAETIASVETR